MTWDQSGFWNLYLVVTNEFKETFAMRTKLERNDYLSIGRKKCNDEMILAFDIILGL